MAGMPSWMLNANDTLSDYTGLVQHKGGPFGMNAYNGNPVDYTGRVHQADMFDTANQAQARQGQANLGAMLANASMGQGPSSAQSQFALQSQQAQNMARGLFNQSRGAGGAMNAYYAAQQQGANTQTAAAQAAILKAQEMQNARAAYGGLLEQQRGQDLQLGQAQNQNAQFNAQSYNQLLADAQNQANQLRAQRNQQIYNQEQARLQNIAQMRNWAIQKVSGGLAGGASDAINAGSMLSMLV